MEFRQIRYALAVAKERSFTQAAERLNVSQSAVSEQIKLLEEEIGFPLFRRTSRGVELTEPGRTYLYEAERVMGDVLSLSDTARRLRGAPTDVMTIGMGSGMAQIFIPRLARYLSTRLSGMRLEILTAPTKNIFHDLHEERIDAGIAIESDPQRVPTGIVFEHLTQAEMALIVPPSHRLARSRRPVEVAALVSEPLIMSELTIGYGQVVLSLFADQGLRPNILAVADNIETIKVVVQSGGGIAIVPRACVANETALGAVVARPLTPRPAVTLSLFRRRQPLSRRKEFYLAAVRAILKG
ncbi:MAG: LysR family transcriptional regulator [Pseudolabrys sp.]|nr:LysR family transcriptional regulator [Pseudolabrys sp.]